MSTIMSSYDVEGVSFVLLRFSYRFHYTVIIHEFLSTDTFSYKITGYIQCHGLVDLQCTLQRMFTCFAVVMQKQAHNVPWLGIL